MDRDDAPDGPVLYCHCAYARIVPPPVKDAVLEALVQRERPFEAVPDLCELAARKDPLMADLAGRENLRIAACFPRAVRWLFHSAGTPLDRPHAIANMRKETAAEVLERLDGPCEIPIDSNESDREG